jgi:uncharacterized protein
MTQADLKQEMKAAMMAKDEVRLLVVRGLMSACTNELVAKGRKPNEELSEEDVQAVISRAVKQRKDSIDQFRKGAREDLAAKEEIELKILESFLPPQMSEAEVEAAVQAKMAEMGPIDKAKSGQFMGAVMKDLKGKADGALVKTVIERLLQ